MKPVLCGATAAALQVGSLTASLMNYFTSKAVLIAASFTTLHPSIQSFLISKFKKASSVPTTLIAKLIGLDVNVAAELIFSKTPQPNVIPNGGTASSKSNASTGGKTGSKQKPTAASTKTAGNGSFPYQGFTDPQAVRLTKAYGGDFKEFLKIKAKFKFKGKIDLLKLANYFKDGKPSFGKLSATAVAEKCLN